MTPRKRQLLDFINSFSRKHGFAPSHEEIGRHFKLAISTVNQHLQELEISGHLSKEKNQPRGISVSQTVPMVRIPLLGTIAAGQPIETYTVPTESIAIPKSKLAQYGTTYALQVRGTSMIDEGINDGDIIIVKEQTTAKNGEKVVALIDNQEATLKKFYKEHGHIRLQPANKKMEPIIIRKDRDFIIQGVVIDIIHGEQRPLFSITEQKVAPLQEQQQPVKQHAKLPLNKIICGDVVSELKKIPDNSIDLAITSPPYNLKNSTGNGMKDGRGGKWSKAALMKGYSHHSDDMPHEEYVAWQRACLKETMRTLKEDGAFFYNHKWRVQGGLLQDRHDIVSGFPVRQIIIWRRKGGINFNRGYFLPTYEVIYLIAKPKFQLAPKASSLGDVWEFGQDLHNPHPAPFPIDFIERIIKSTNAKTVLDPFMGSGTTAIAALNLNRNYIGIDISPEYCKMAEERIENYKKGIGKNGFIK